jgi:ADP-ribosylglycohydrolase
MLALEGLSVGDAFGDRYFGPGVEVMPRIERRELAAAPWPWTDDTHMALSIVEMLCSEGTIDQDALALRFAERMDPHRKYGVGAFNLLTAIRDEGAAWRRASVSLFDGRGSFGNGAAMRVAPLGAYFADDLARTVHEARLASEVTHAHSEGIAGGIAVAVAAAHACLGALDTSLFDVVLAHTPRGYLHETITEARSIAGDVGLVEAASRLGNGSGVTAPDTVPLCLWICAHHARTYEEALWTTVAALGDRDTTCAIVGGVVTCARGIASVPAAWLAAREPLLEVRDS